MGPFGNSHLQILINSKDPSASLRVNSTIKLYCACACITWVSLKKQVISRILCILNLFRDFIPNKNILIIYLDQWLPKGSIRLPFSTGVQPLTLIYMALHRIEFT